MRTEKATTEFLGVEFANLTYEEAALELDRLSRKKSFSYIVTPNVDHVLRLHEEQNPGIRTRFNAAYEAAAHRLCDSKILRLLARYRGIRLQLVTGSDLTAFLFERGHFNGKKVAFIGGDEAMLAELRERFPAIELVQHIPPMGLLRDSEGTREIETFLGTASCDYALFAFGAPQSEIVAHHCLQAGRARGVGLCIGASIEFVLGRKARAPAWMRYAHLEWAFRLILEPRRLWKRYLITGPRIFRLALFDDNHSF